MVDIKGLHDLVLFYSQVPSCLPYVGAYLDKIYSLEIGTATYNTNGLVNFSKMTKVSFIDSKVHCVTTHTHAFLFIHTS